MVERKKNFPIKAFLLVWLVVGFALITLEIIRLREVVFLLKEENYRLRNKNE
jgi:hypothetical protein